MYTWKSGHVKKWCEDIANNARTEASGGNRPADTFILTSKIRLAGTWLWLVYQAHTAPWEENPAILRFSTCKRPLKTHGHCRGNV